MSATHLMIVSVVGFFVSIALCVGVLIFLPRNYFCDDYRPLFRHSEHKWYLAVFVIKNAFGAALLLAGIVMLALPGQGILTILIAVIFLDFPGKRRLEKKLIMWNGILITINKLRRRFHKPDLVVNGEQTSHGD